MIEVTPDRWGGSRDRSWGVRPIGEAEPPGIQAGGAPPPFRWVYCPFDMGDHAVYVIWQSDGGPDLVLSEAVRVFADPQRPDERLGVPSVDLRFVPGTRLVDRATLRCRTTDGTETTFEVEPLLALHVGIGTGYGFDADWRHGMYQGDLVVQGLEHDLSTEEGRAAMFGIVDHAARYTDDQGRTGYGLFEHLVLGPWEEYGLSDFLDGAP